MLSEKQQALKDQLEVSNYWLELDVSGRRGLEPDSYLLEKIGPIFERDTLLLTADKKENHLCARTRVYELHPDCPQWGTGQVHDTWEYELKRQYVELTETKFKCLMALI